MFTFQEFLKMREDKGLFSQNSTGDPVRYNQKPDPNLVFHGGAYKDSGFQGNTDSSGGASGGIGPSPSPIATPPQQPGIKKMKKDGGDDATGMYTGTLSGGLGGATPLRMRKK